MLKNVSLYTVGCKLNYSETSILTEKLANYGLEIKNYGENTDLFVLNTCCVTENSEKDCKKIIRQVKRKNPDTFIIVTGCYAQLKAENVANHEGVDLVLGNNEKFNIVKYVKSIEKQIQSEDKINFNKINVTDINAEDGFNIAYSSVNSNRTRAFLKIQDGCNYNCTYCVVPLARGKSRSDSITNILDSAKKLINSGYKEIILTGVNIGDYNYKKKYFLIDLLEKIEKLNINRIRISSIEPNLFTDEIISLIKSSSKFCGHFHIPLQSGDDKILSMMGRKYNTDMFRELILKLNEYIKDVNIGIDVITGFPGEDDKSFALTYEYINGLPIGYMHVFTYSERENTKSIDLKSPVTFNVRKERSQKLRNLSHRKKTEFYRKFSGSIQEVLFEKAKYLPPGKAVIEGFTRNYIRVITDGEENLENKIRKVRLKQSEDNVPIKCEILHNKYK